MTAGIAALPMYDWPERREEVDAEWAAIRDRLCAAGIDAPAGLTRATGDLLDFWKRPDVLLAQTCWGPLELGLADHVHVVGQQNYDGIEGGKGECYSSAIVMRRQDAADRSATGFDAPPSVLPDIFPSEGGMPAPTDGKMRLPLDLLRGKRFAFNVPDSMSGIMGLARDLQAIRESLDIFADRIETGGHRASIRAVAQSRADVAAIDCMSWALAERHEPAAHDLVAVGWTAPRKGLPFITAKTTPPDVVAVLKTALSGASFEARFARASG